eukprot:5317637-Prymnesium_polylepis.1
MHGVTIAPPPNHKPLTACDLINRADRCPWPRSLAVVAAQSCHICASPTDKPSALAARSVAYGLRVIDPCNYRPVITPTSSYM